MYLSSISFTSVHEFWPDLSVDLSLVIVEHVSDVDMVLELGTFGLVKSLTYLFLMFINFNLFRGLSHNKTDFRMSYKHTKLQFILAELEVIVDS